MKRLFGRSAPIGVQVLLLVLFSVGVAQAINAVVLLVSPRPERAEQAPERVARLLTGAENSGDFDLSRHNAAPVDDRVDQRERELADSVAAALGQPAEEVRAILMSSPPPGAGTGTGQKGAPQSGFIVARRLPDGGWIWLERRPGWLSEWQRRTLLWLLLSGLLIAPAALLFARRFIRPVRAFAESAERIGADPQSAMMTVSGPAEIEEAAAAIRRMQERIGRYVEDRTAMVAAIAHDLRTPLTRLAFRLQALPPDERDAAMDDIDEMQGMIGSALDFVKGISGTEEKGEVDLTAVVTAAAAGLTHETSEISVEVGPAVMVRGNTPALHRLVSNLLQNAIRYGQRARASVTTTNGYAALTVDDDGPGVAEAELERIFDPFYRLEPSRSRASGGAGLGLSIARSIALDHGGALMLSNRSGGGLRATLTLPLLR